MQHNNHNHSNYNNDTSSNSSGSSSSNTINRNNNNFVHFETTPREYYDHCTTATPNYDLYPSLSRRLMNGYHNKPPPPSRKCNRRRDRQINFATMNMIQRERTTSNTWYHPHPTFDLFARLPPDDEQEQHDNHNHQEEDDDQQIPPWDLYPLVLRNVENFGTEQMRQRLHRAMTMV